MISLIFYKILKKLAKVYMTYIPLPFRCLFLPSMEGCLVPRRSRLLYHYLFTYSHEALKVQKTAICSCFITLIPSFCSTGFEYIGCRKSMLWPQYPNITFFFYCFESCFFKYFWTSLYTKFKFSLKENEELKAKFATKRAAWETKKADLMKHAEDPGN